PLHRRGTLPALGVTVGHQCGGSPFFPAAFEAISKESAGRRSAHRPALASRSLPAETVGRRLAPLRSSVDSAHLNPCHLAVAAIRVALEPARETPGQRILMNEAVGSENVAD